MGVPVYVSELPEIEITDGPPTMACLHFEDQDVFMPLNLLRRGNLRISAAIAAHDAAHGVIAGPLRIAEGGRH